jgi:hypothetical protein
VLWVCIDRQNQSADWIQVPSGQERAKENQRGVSSKGDRIAEEPDGLFGTIIAAIVLNVLNESIGIVQSGMTGLLLNAPIPRNGSRANEVKEAIVLNVLIEPIVLNETIGVSVLRRVNAAIVLIVVNGVKEAIVLNAAIVKNMYAKIGIVKKHHPEAIGVPMGNLPTGKVAILVYDRPSPCPN